MTQIEGEESESEDSDDGAQDEGTDSAEPEEADSPEDSESNDLEDIRARLRKHRKEIIKKQPKSPEPYPFNLNSPSFLESYRQILKQFQPMIEALSAPPIKGFLADQTKLYQEFGAQFRELIVPALQLPNFQAGLTQPFLQLNDQLSEQHRLLLKSISDTAGIAGTVSDLTTSALFPGLKGLSDFSRDAAAFQNLRELIKDAQFRDLSRFRFPELLDWDLGSPQDGEALPPDFLDVGFEFLEEAVDSILRAGRGVLGDDAAIRLSVMALYFRQSGWKERMHDLEFSAGIALSGPAILFSLQAFIDQPSIMTFLMLCLSIWGSGNMPYPGELPPVDPDDSEKRE